MLCLLFLFDSEVKQTNVGFTYILKETYKPCRHTFKQAVADVCNPPLLKNLWRFFHFSLTDSTLSSQPTCSVFQQFHLLFVCHCAELPLMVWERVKRVRSTFYPPTQSQALPRSVHSLRRGALHSGTPSPHFELPWQQLGKFIWLGSAFE